MRNRIWCKLLLGSYRCTPGAHNAAREDELPKTRLLKHRRKLLGVLMATGFEAAPCGLSARVRRPDTGADSADSATSETKAESAEPEAKMGAEAKAESDAFA